MPMPTTVSVVVGLAVIAHLVHDYAPVLRCAGEK